MTKLGHQTIAKELLAREQVLLSCINVMHDRRGPDEVDERAFTLAYLQAYQILTGSALGLAGEEIRVDPEELERRNGE